MRKTGYPLFARLELIGGPQKEKIFCYASNTDISYGTPNSIEWFLELGFKAVKLFLRDGPDSGLAGINRSVELVATTREQVGDDIEIAVDAWMSMNTDYVVRLAEALRPYKIKWLEDYMLPEDMDSYFNVRQRIPFQTLATGEHWYSIHPFALAASHGLVDIFQPDLGWVGGLTAGIKICHLAEAHAAGRGEPDSATCGPEHVSGAGYAQRFVLPAGQIALTTPRSIHA